MNRPFTITITDKEVADLGLKKPYLHREGSNKLVRSDFTRLPVSKTLWSKSKDLLPLLDGLTGFIPLPAYLNEAGGISDFQLAVTGSVDLNEEESTTTCIREIGEEIGLNVTLDDITQLNAFDFKTKIQTTACLFCPNEFEPAEPIGRETRGNSKTKKVVTWILMDKREDILNRRRLPSTDTAGKVVVVIDVDDLRKLIRYFFKK